MKFEIKNRWSGNVMFTAEIQCEENASFGIKVGLALKAAVKAKAVLRDANLRGANLRDANLRGAVLSGANLRDADLSGANLRDANLSGANLRDANLSGAVLSGANLRDADLRDADLSDADLRDADLSDADLPVLETLKFPKLHTKIKHATDVDGSLQMSTRHTCETTHCRAGWAIHLLGGAGKTLEAIVGSACAGGLIYAANYPDEKIPNFYAENEEAKADIDACAAREAAKV